MIAYNKRGLINLQIQEETELAYNDSLLTEAELSDIKKKYPADFYSPGIWIRFGLFILTFIIAASAAGLLALLLMESNVLDSPGWVYFLAIAFYGALELLVYNGKHYRSGADDAMILITAGTLLTAVCWSVFSVSGIGDEASFQIISTAMFFACGYLALRFADALMGVCTFTALLVAVFFTVYRNAPSLQQAIPFIMIICSALIYLLANKAYTNLKAWYYEQALILLQVAALMTFYFAGNYFVVNSLNIALISNADHPAVLSAPFKIFFWAWTIVVPLAYIGLGLRNKNVILLRSGLLLVAAATFTIRTYFHLMSLEALLCLIGVLLIAIAYGVIKYLKVPKHGFTYEETADKHLMDNLRVESLIVNETFSGAPGSPADTTRFGGGDFGGGGASGNF